MVVVSVENKSLSQSNLTETSEFTVLSPGQKIKKVFDNSLKYFYDEANKFNAKINHPLFVKYALEDAFNPFTLEFNLIKPTDADNIIQELYSDETKPALERWVENNKQAGLRIIYEDKDYLSIKAALVEAIEKRKKLVPKEGLEPS